MNMPPPNQQQPPMMNRAPNARPPTAEGFPLLAQPSAAVNSPPYPVNQSTMPQPLIQNENKTGITIICAYNESFKLAFFGIYVKRSRKMGLIYMSQIIQSCKKTNFKILNALLELSNSSNK